MCHLLNEYKNTHDIILSGFTSVSQEETHCLTGLLVQILHLIIFQCLYKGWHSNVWRQLKVLAWRSQLHSLHLFPLALLIVPFGWEALHRVHPHVQHPFHLHGLPFLIKGTRMRRIHWESKKCWTWTDLFTHFNPDMISELKKKIKETPYHSTFATEQPGQWNQWRKRCHPPPSSTHPLVSSSQRMTL